MPDNTTPSTQASKTVKKQKSIDVFLSLSSQDLVNLFNQKTVTLEKAGISFAFTLSEFDSEDVTRLETAHEALEDIVNDLIDERDDDDVEDDDEDDDDDEDGDSEEEPEVPEEDE
jgi:hypothetical protein